MDQSGEHPEQSGEYPPEMMQGEEGEYYEGQEGEYQEGMEGYEGQEGEYPEGEYPEGEYPEGYPEGYEPQEGEEEMMMRSGMEEGQMGESHQLEGHDMTGQQQSHMEGHEGEEGQHGEEGEEEEDPYRKIKADLLETINSRRKDATLDQLRTDIIMQAMAEEYVMYLADNNEPDATVLKQLSENHLNHGDYEFVMVKAKFEEETDLSPEIIASTFIDSCYVWFEVQEDRNKLMKKEYNAIGLGAIATMECVYAVVVLGYRQISLSKVCNGEDGGIEVRGRMNTSEFGVYAVRLYNPETNKDIIAVGPEAIEMDRVKREFIVFLECDDTIQASAKMCELYVRGNPGTINYKKPRSEKLKLSDVILSLRAPCVLFPDAKALAAEERDRARREAERLSKQKAEEEAKRRRDAENAARRERKRQRRQDLEEARARGEVDVESIYSSTVRSEQSYISKQSLTNPAALEAAHRSLQREKEELAAANESPNKMSVSQGPDDQGQSVDEQRMQESVEEEKRMQAQFQQRPEVIKDQGISNKEIREELEKAIGEAEKQLSELEHQNAVLQEKIVTFRKKNEAMMGEKQGDVTMNPHKYLNTLAHVHQIGLELQQTKERYNKMTADLEKNLKEKKRKCNEIKEAFMRLKREVSKKAAFSRTDKPIPEQLVEDLEQKEVDKDKELYTLRLQILSLRNNLAKNQKIIKKKEELAEGLHLIDYEQLKIENQTLNEKIEERNEDLHKLKKKNTMTVQVLTHTKEKLQFISTKIAFLEHENNLKELDMKDQTTKLNEFKKERDAVRKTNTSLRQQTGIVNSNVLRNDHGNLKAQNQGLRNEHMDLKRKHEYMIEIINEYNRLKKLEDTNNHQTTNGRRLK